MRRGIKGGQEPLIKCAAPPLEHVVSGPSRAEQRPPAPSMRSFEPASATQERKNMLKLLQIKNLVLVTSIGAFTVISGARSVAWGQSPPRFKAIAFDYFVIFDPNSVVPEV